jgi:hypothetical protein
MGLLEKIKENIFLQVLLFYLIISIIVGIGDKIVDKIIGNPAPKEKELTSEEGYNFMKEGEYLSKIMAAKILKECSWKDTEIERQACEIEVKREFQPLWYELFKNMDNFALLIFVVSILQYSEMNC